MLRCVTSMLNSDDFHYAMEQTRVILPPEKRLETFGNSFVNYYLVTEEMDSVALSYVREGTIVAERPQIITPGNLSKLLLEGFGDQAERFADQINHQAHKFAVLKYGFSVKKSDTRFYEVHEPFEQVIEKVKEDVLGRKRSDGHRVGGGGCGLGGVFVEIHGGHDPCLRGGECAGPAGPRHVVRPGPHFIFFRCSQS
ncbi:MAG: hypothetical protein HC904_07275 [Blastochloris sp.]|nr:hypothetical protein [Blastochloris sp.]